MRRCGEIVVGIVCWIVWHEGRDSGGGAWRAT
jgi:hypothetical protein